ncbi:MAG TPA: carboxypeptidase-like regulatory domain-containing protein, partial [Gemmatimonadota bacterium]|nr:carboxypeptidase-like regulatory domain-containing protein [Gemmatimonadota bacterium]
MLFLVGAGAARAQEGTVTGQVSDQASLEPLVGAQVFLPGTQLGTLTDDQGHYRITGVPAGSHEVRVRLIGYRSAARNVSVEAGQAVTADFRLSVSAVSLEEVVVTATGTQRQRELGHAVSTIDAASQIQKSESNNLADLIQGNATGVSIRQSSGSVGTGSTIKIRGNSSISLDNTPLIYVDGVRVANDNDVNTVNATLDVGGQRPSRLNDLNPQDIESIDVLKGPSAVTLYGTEAAAGVILITTKKGRQGQTQYNFRAELGGNWDATSWPAMAIDFSSYFGFGKDTIYQSRLFDGEPGIKSPFRTGMQNTYAASVRGGLQGIDYFVSGQYQNLQGNLPSNDVTKWNARGNLSIHPSDKVDISVSNGFV